MTYLLGFYTKGTALLVGLYIACTLSLQAQDLQLSQYYAAPLFTNPALTGLEGNTRAMLHYRNQWAGLDANFVTYLGSTDYYFSHLRSGVGLYVLQDNLVQPAAATREVALQYAYNLQLNEEHFVRLGLQGAWINRSINYAALSFPDQFNNQGSTGLPSLDPFASTLMTSYWNIGTGAFYYNQKAWAGIALHNLSRPDQSLFADGSARLPIRYTLQGGYKFLLNKFDNWRDAYRDFNEISISPTFLYKRQAGFDQLDLGAYFTYSPLVAGLWYRGLPVKQVNPRYTNHESLIALLGIRWKQLHIGYSFDYTISGLGIQSGGAHELSIAIHLKTEERKGTKRRKAKPMPCPQF